MARLSQFKAKYNSKCSACGGWINRGELVQWSKTVRKKVEHVYCPEKRADKPDAVASVAPPTLELSPLSPSAYQQAIFDDLMDDTGNRVVEAVAGSGKTWTLVESLKRLIVRHGGHRSQVLALFLAFNRHIAKELQSKVQHAAAQISTAHSFGLKTLRDGGVLGKFKVESNKTKQLLFNQVFIYEMLDKDEIRELYRMLPAIAKLVSLGKGHVVRSALDLRDVWRDYCNKFDVTIPDRLTKDFEAVLMQVYDASINCSARVDFDDMIFLPLFHNLSIPTFPYVFIDEAQDLNPAQQELVRLAGRDGRVIAVGDRFQAIYGFTGADTDSIPNLIELLDAKVLPLSTCYRCGTEIVAAAQAFVPHIEAAADADAGEISSIHVDDFQAEAKDGDFALCRVTAPLVRHCLNFIRKGRKAVIIGRDIAKDLATLVKDVSATDAKIGEFLVNLEIWVDAKLEKLALRQNSENQRIAVQDKFDTLVALSDELDTVEELLERIELIFSDEGSPGITLSTIHRAKGLEADRVFILRPDLLPHPLAKQAWQVEQEHNLHYVAITRARKELIYVEGDEREGGGGNGGGGESRPAVKPEKDEKILSLSPRLTKSTLIGSDKAVAASTGLPLDEHREMLDRWAEIKSNM